MKVATGGVPVTEPDKDVEPTPRKGFDAWFHTVIGQVVAFVALPPE